MSKGPGRIERVIRQLFDDNPDLAFTTEELARLCYPEADPIEKKHTVSVLRAVHKVIARDPDWDTRELGEGYNAGLIFINRDSVESVALADLTRDRIRWQRRAGRSRWVVQADADAVDLREELRRWPVYRDQMAPGGGWHRVVAWHRARRDGDTERLAQLNAEDQAERRRLIGG